MVDSDKIFSGSMPELYDTYLVPLLFEPYANDIVSRAAALAPSSVLETAAGSGVVTRAMTARLADDACYLVTDLNQPMLDYAASRQDPDARITFQQADAAELPFEDAAFDVVFCQFGVMFFSDRIAAYAETLRVLKPGGQFFFSCWDRIAENQFADVITEALAAVFPDDPPQFLARTPHGYHDLDLVRRELDAAGFSETSVTTLAETSSAPSPRHAAIAYCQGTPLRTEIEARDAGRLDEVTDVAAAAITKQFGDGRVSGNIQGHVVTAAA